MNAQTNLDSDTLGFADVAKYGKGMWYVIHTMASGATTEPLQLAFIHYIKYLAKSLNVKNVKAIF